MSAYFLGTDKSLWVLRMWQTAFLFLSELCIPGGVFLAQTLTTDTTAVGSTTYGRLVLGSVATQIGLDIPLTVVLWLVMPRLEGFLSVVVEVVFCP